MSCPTCSHTMQQLLPPTPGIRQFFWCPRCGTLQTVSESRLYLDAPMLVERCRKFELYMQGVAGFQDALAMFHTIGVSESINLPENRPTIL